MENTLQKEPSSNDVRRQIVYEAETLGLNYWQPAWVTEALGSGDCEDFAIIMRERLVLAGFILPKEGSLGLVSTSGIGGDVDHAVLVLDFDGGVYVADSSRGLQKRMDGNWSLAQTIDLTSWWDDENPIGMTLEQYKKKNPTN